MLRKTPGMTVVVTITLALGIGANALIFSVVNGFLLQPMPVSHPEQIAVLAATQKGDPPRFLNSPIRRSSISVNRPTRSPICSAAASC